MVTYYVLTHNLTATGNTTIINNTIPVVNVSLDGVPSGNYSVNVAAVNIVGQGTSAQETVTGSTLHNITNHLYLLIVILSSTSSVAGIAVTSTDSAENSPIENGVAKSSSRGVPNASTDGVSSLIIPLCTL